jgi:8-oxo-dGTP pyrophosphatase MutT (NUDIX family)
MKIATLAIILRDGKVLLGEKKTGEIGIHTLNGPGGKCESGETLIDCVVRETREEVGVELHRAALINIAVITFYVANVPDFEVHVFRTESFSGIAIETDSMVPYWYDVHSLPLERMLESDRAWFPRAVQGDRFDARVYYRKRAKEFYHIVITPH